MATLALKIGDCISLPKNVPTQTTAGDYVGYDNLCSPSSKQGVVVKTALGANYGHKSLNVLNVDILTTTGKITGFVQSDDILITLLEGDQRTALMSTITNLLTSKQHALTLAFAMLQKPYIGCDPEVFVVDEQNECIPAWTFLPDKAKAEKVSDPYSNHVFVFWDGPQAEFALNGSAPTCLEIITSRVREGLAQIRRAATKNNPNARISLTNLITLPQETLDTAEDKVLALGCAPSLNVYDLPQLNVPNPRKLVNRSAGWHVHLSNLNRAEHKAPIDPTMAPEIIRALDKTIGVLSVAMCEGLESPLRRRYYGWPGEYRLPKHGGIEYRVCGPAPFLAHPAIHHLSWEIIRRTVMAVQFGIFDKLWKADTDEVIETILTLNVEKARRMFEENLDAFKMLLQTYEEFDKSCIIDQAVRVVRNGIAKVVKDPHDVANHWGLDPTDSSNNAYWSWRSASQVLHNHKNHLL